MLDLDHPQTPLVFAASKQLDLVLDYCKKITLSGTAGRQFMLEVIRPSFAALRWLAANRFADEPLIADGIAELERQAEQLAGLPLRDQEHRGGIPNEYDPTNYCSPCLNVIMPGLLRVRSCEEGFGTEAI